MTDTDPLVEIADEIRELTDPQHHAERYVMLDARNRPQKPKHHLTRHPSLLDQLRAAASAGRDGGDGPMVGGYESKPAARLEAIGQLLRIEQAVDDWLVRIFDVTPRRGIEDQLRQVAGLAPTLDTRKRVHLAAEVHRWRIWARVVTGWDSPPWQPNVPCPCCERRGELRIRMLDKTAACLHCGAVWDASTFGLLADQIASMDAAAVGAEQARSQLAADLANFFPRRGPCLCGLAGAHDARHREVDQLVAALLDANGDLSAVAEAHGVPVRAVEVAMNATLTFADLEPYPPKEHAS